MAYSTTTEFRKNVTKVESTGDYSDADVVLRIAQADSKIETDLANIIDFDLVPAVTASPATPDFINLLSQYKTAELSLVALYGGRREVLEVSDIQYWQEEYNTLKEQIIMGKIPLELSDGTSVAGSTIRFSRESKDGVAPALGMGDYGEFIDDDDLADERPE